MRFCHREHQLSLAVLLVCLPPTIQTKANLNQGTYDICIHALYIHIYIYSIIVLCNDNATYHLVLVDPNQFSLKIHSFQIHNILPAPGSQEWFVFGRDVLKGFPPNRRKVFCDTEATDLEVYRGSDFWNC